MSSQPESGPEKASARWGLRVISQRKQLSAVRLSTDPPRDGAGLSKVTDNVCLVDAPVIAAIVTSTVTPVLAGFAAWLGSRVGAKAVREGQRWETIRSAAEKVHSKDLPEARLAFNQLSGLVVSKKLTPEQVDWVEYAIRSFSDRTPPTGVT